MKNPIYLLLVCLFFIAETFAQNFVELKNNIQEEEIYNIPFQEFFGEKLTKIMASPIDSNMLWLGGSNYNKQLDLITGNISSVNSLGPFKISKNSFINSNIALVDSGENSEEFWFYIDNTGLVRLNLQTYEYEIIDIPLASCMCNCDNYLFIGTEDSYVYKIDLKNYEQHRRLAGINLKVWNLKCKNEKDLIINNEIRYNFNRNKISFMSVNVKDSVNYLFDRPEKLWVYPSSKFNQYVFKDEVWFYNDKNIWLYDTINGLLYRSNYTTNFQIRSMSVNNDNVFLLGNLQVFKLSKTLLKNSLVSLNPLNTKENRIHKLENERFEKEVDFQAIMDSIKSITNKIIKDSIEFNPRHISSDIGYLVCNNSHRHVLLRKLQSEIFSPEFYQAVYYVLVKYYYLQSEIDKAIFYDSLLVNTYPKTIWVDKSYHANIEKLHNVKFKMQQLDSLDIKPDEYLWLKSEIYKELASSDWNCGEFCGDAVYSRFYDQLISKYPESEYVDNAKFNMLKNYYYGASEGGDFSSNLVLIDMFERFLIDYPDSEFSCDVYNILGGLYQTADIKWSMRSDYLKTSLNYYLKVNNNCDEDKKLYLTQVIEEVERDLNVAAIEFIIEPEKMEYTENDTIKIMVTYKNNASVSQSEYGPFVTNLPMAYFYVEQFESNHYKMEFESLIDIKSINKELTLNPGEEIKASANLSTGVISSGMYGYDYGVKKFNLKKGKYRIMALGPFRCNEYYISSNEIEIEIK